MITTTCILLAATMLGEGTCGVYSPDGGKIAMQRVVAGKSRVGVLNRASGGFDWIEQGTGNAAHPAWSPSGDAIVYSYGNETNTAWAARNGDTGYHLRIWRESGIREITTGRFRDYMPSFADGGSTVLFASTRGVPPDVFQATRSGLYSVGADGGEPCCLVSSETNNMGMGQPVVSPDGKLAAFAQIDSFYVPWRIACARMTNMVRRCAVTPKGQSAYAPRWTPDGRHLVYTGFSKGDPGWCVYVLNPRTGGVKRICEGRNPDVHPSGALLLYDDGAQLYERPFGADDLPGDDDIVVDEESLLYDEPESIVWNAARPDYPATIPMTSAFVFGTNRTFFVRMKVHYVATETLLCHYLIGAYEGASLGFQLFTDNGLPKFGARDGDGAYISVSAGGRLESGGEYVLTGIRTSDSLIIHIEGQSLYEARFGSTYPLNRPIRLEVGPTLGGTGDIILGEVGTGWPENVPHPLTRTKFFAEEGSQR